MFARRRRRFGWGHHIEVDLFTERHETYAETLSQAIRAATAEQLDAGGSVLFGHMQATVVGLRFYTGVVNQGELVGLVREQQNPYDDQAVMVVNIYGSQVGHLKREQAAAMASILDNQLANVEGLVYTGMKNKYSMPVILSFWGREENKNAVIGCLTRHGFKLSTGSHEEHSNSPGTSRKGLTIPLTPEELKNAFDNLFVGLMESKDGEKEAAESVSTPLMLHQKQALSWMCARENKFGLPPFWEKRGELYYNTLTCFSAKEIPERVRGGILADDMGLGKTLTTIALILTNFHNGTPLPVEKCEEGSSFVKAKQQKASILRGSVWNEAGVSGAATSSQHSDLPQEEVTSADTPDTVELKDEAEKSQNCQNYDSCKGDNKGTKRLHSKAPALLEGVDPAAALSGSSTDTVPKKKSKTAKKVPPTHVVESPIPESVEELSARTTLIICPLSVLSNWLEQFEQHVSANVKLNVYLYYGPDRNRSIKFLSSQDVVITTYNILSADFGNKSPLPRIGWLRVVLDEGHIIRNPNTQMSKAVLELKACRRWIITGTPIQNGVKDLWMLLAFLHLQPFNVKEWWNRVIQRPVIEGDRAGLQNLQTLVKFITLRRTKNSQVKGRPLVCLPEKVIYVEQVELTRQEREEYVLACQEGRITISRYVAEGTVLSNYADVLAILMRLRQQCCHPDLLAQTFSDLGEAATPAELRKRLIDKLRSVLASGSVEECSVCLDFVSLPVITHCAHIFCRPCIARVISSGKIARCPLCRNVINTNELVEFPQEEVEEENAVRWRTSSKLEALMGNLLRVRCEDSSIKCLVVSQFTRFLTILETPLREHGFSFVRLDGTLSQKRRAQVIQEFQSTDDVSPTIMLLSLKAGGVGLNLTAASRVYLMDPAWNPATEDQCIDRCHRLGQRRQVVVTKFIVTNSVEERMVNIQRRKQDLVEKAFGSSSADRKSSRIDDLKALMAL